MLRLSRIETMIDLVYVPDDVLVTKASPVKEIDEETKDLAVRMIEAVQHYEGIGLAAPQVNVLQRMFIVYLRDDKPRVFINPEILETSMEENVIEEGCLSIPGIYAEVKRPAEVSVQAFDQRGKPFTLEAEGMLARVIQHEYDHLNGVLFTDHLSDGKRQRLMKKYRKPVS
ncbi:MAG: peptide deformylase [Alkalispirochaetaceae bacterium]